MKKLRLLSILVVLLCSARLGQGAEESAYWVLEALTPETQVDYDLATRTTTATHGVKVTHGEEVLTADQMTINEVSGDIIGDGSVTLRRGSQYWTSSHLEYNYITQQLKAESFRTGASPFFVSGVGLSLDITNKNYTATEALITTDDVENPGLKIRAKRLKIEPGKAIEARDAVLYVGSVPLGYFPYYRRSLERHPNNFAVTPGYRSLYGAYLLGAYNWVWSDALAGTFHLDYRQKRGFGGGPDFQYDLGRWGEGTLKTYYARDDKPGNDPAGQPIRSDRNRISFTHQATLRTNLTAKVVVREQSDAYVVRDFYESEYQKNVQPSSFLEVNQRWSNFSLNALAQPQINDFFETVERLPDVKLTGIRQQLGISPFYYESESSAGYFRYRFADPTKDDYAAFRADSFHQLVLPRNYFGWLNITPRVGGRFTYYSESDGRGTTTREEQRWVFNTGAEVSTKASRTWAGTRSRFWDVTGLRHIIEPSINYVFVPSPNKLPPQLPQFDRELPSFALLPIEYPDYNAIDSIDSQNVLRLSLRNKLQTKRHNNIEDLVNWAVYTDWRLKPRSDQGTFADLYSELDLRPRSWLTLTSETRYDLDADRWRYSSHYLTLQPSPVWSYSIGHRYLRSDDATFGPNSGNNLITSRLFYRLNENYAFRIAHRFEARDGQLEEQYYTLYRDLRSWTAALTFRVRANRGAATDYTVALTFSLKAFPRFRLGDDRENPSLLLGS